MIKSKKNAGFSLIELMISMAILLVLLGLISTLFARSLNTRTRESRRTDALTSAQAALNVMSREIANSGFGLIQDKTTGKFGNGIITADSGSQKLHFLSNVLNTDGHKDIDTPGEDVTYFYDSTTKSIVRYDRFAIWDSATSTYKPQTSVIINRISDVEFKYYDYTTASSSTTSYSTTPTKDTGRVTIKVTVSLEDVQNQPKDQKVKFESDVTLRNSNYMLNQY